MKPFAVAVHLHVTLTLSTVLGASYRFSKHRALLPSAEHSVHLPASLLLSVLCCELGCCDSGPGVPVDPVGERTSSWTLCP